MTNLYNPNSTICAIATPAGGAIGIVRVSGPKALTCVSPLFQPMGSKTLAEKAGGTLTFGRIVDPTSHETVDEVLVSLFRAPHSYTGEDSIEISCHGSAYILNRVLQLLLAQGCRMAQPGEYTQRAFMNGKMDLSQAEAVADLIASTTAANHRMAMQQMRGGFSRKLKELREKLLHLTALMELELDFSDHEDLEFASRQELFDLATHIRMQIGKLCQSFSLGNALKRGFPVAIVGETNAGKSTLLNALVGEERALVSNIHGTTRDTVEETIVLGDTLIRFIDTAGIRATTDTVERMGIERTYEKIDEAQIVIWLLDATCALDQFRDLQGKVLCPGKHYLLAVNKTDLLDAPALAALQTSLNENLRSLLSSNSPHPTTEAEATDRENATAPIIHSLLYLSAHHETDIESIRHHLSSAVQSLRSNSTDENDIIVSNVRHYEALTQAHTAIERVIEGLNTGLSGDFISQDLRECTFHLGAIIGEIPTESVLATIFKKFCIGK